MKKSIGFFIMFLILGCARHDPRYDDIDISNNKRLYSLNHVISVNGSNSFPKNPWKAWSDYRSDHLSLKRHLPNLMSEDVRIEVSTLEKENLPKYFMLNKARSEKMEEQYKNFQTSEWEKSNNAERGIAYVKRYVDYIAELRCATRVESGSIALGVGRKSYQTNCNYFDRNGDPKLLHLGYDYMFTYSGTKFDGDKKSQAQVVTPEAMQKQFKEDMKAIFDSLQIHDMDRERMAKEGLLHDRKYEIQEW